jgi:hypothetical protein
MGLHGGGEIGRFDDILVEGSRESIWAGEEYWRCRLIVRDEYLTMMTMNEIFPCGNLFFYIHCMLFTALCKC